MFLSAHFVHKHVVSSLCRSATDAQSIPLPAVGFTALVFCRYKNCTLEILVRANPRISQAVNYTPFFLSKVKRLGTLNLTGFHEPRLLAPHTCLVTPYFRLLSQPPSPLSHQPESPSSQGRLNRWGLNFTQQCLSQRMFSPLG